MDLKFSRLNMVNEQLKARGIEDDLVLNAMAKVPRHKFVEEALQPQAYSDNALPIGFGQTISQPYIVARMTEALKISPGMKVLEIGTGSGYQAAVLEELGAEVYSVERIKPLFNSALKLLNSLRYFNVKLKLEDGTLGWSEKSPFERILVTAGGPKVPVPLLKQLKDPGMLLMPIASGTVNGVDGQRLLRIRIQDGKWYRQDLGPVHFVNLVGEHGW